MNVLALDLGTKTGWAASFFGIESGVQVFDLKRGESPGMRYIRFRHWLVHDIGFRVRPHLIVYEQTHHRGGAATEVAAGFSTRVQEHCADLTIQHAAVHSATLKKWATGKGNAGKPAMVAEARRRHPDVEIIDDNHADALLLLDYALAEVVPAGRSE